MIQPNIMLITDQNALKKFCDSLKNETFITIDTEFLREKTYYAKLCLIQIGDKDKNAAAIDVLADGLNLDPVFDLLFNDKILKVFHAGRQDLEIFHNLTGKVVSPVFDTQIAAMVCGYGDSIGYNNLVRNITGTEIDKSSQFADWSRRPLSEKQIDYALGDVTHLVDVYTHLSAELDKQGRLSWVFAEEEILNDPATYENDPYAMWEKIKIKSPKPKSLAILREIAAWREKRAQKKNIPRTWIMRDETLVDMAAQAPTTAKKLSKIRNMSQDMANGRHGAAIIEIIGSVLASDSKNWPQPKKRKSIPPRVAATIDILRMLLKIQSLENGVATKLIADSDDLEAIAMGKHEGCKSLKGWRKEVFGSDALALEKGELAIGLKKGKIVKYKMSSDSELY